MSILSEKLREKRRASGLKVQEVLDRLKEHEVFISDKTLYNWENGIRNPNADEFFALCEIYEVESLNEFREIKKSPTPERAEDDTYMKFVGQLTRMLASFGLIDESGDITDEDRRFILSVASMLNTYFENRG